MPELDGKTWTKYSISIWDDLTKSKKGRFNLDSIDFSVWNIEKTKGEEKIGHPAMFPIELPKRLIKIYTKKEETVLDPFMGSGTTLLASRELGRKSIGFEISKDFVDLAKKRLSLKMLYSPQFLSDQENTENYQNYPIYEPIIYQDDANKMLGYLNPDSIDFCITSPPYWDIHRQKRTSDYKDIRPYTDLEYDLGNITDYKEFLDAIGRIFEKVYITLKPNRYCIIVVMDIRKKSKFYPFHMDISDMMKGIGFELDDIIIWDRRKEYNNIRPLGYPSVFRVNKVHEYILIFKSLK